MRVPGLRTNRRRHDGNVVGSATPLREFFPASRLESALSRAPSTSSSCCADILRPLGHPDVPVKTQRRRPRTGGAYPDLVRPYALSALVAGTSAVAAAVVVGSFAAASTGLELTIFLGLLVALIALPSR